MMISIIQFMLVCFIICLFSLEAGELPTALIDSVNVITGQTIDKTSDHQYEYYVAGNNSVAGKQIELPRKDWRIGRVKTQRKTADKSPSTSFIYNEGSTEIIDSQKNKKSIHYSKNLLIEAIEHFSSEKEDGQLYKTERFHWDTSFKIPQLISHTLEDGNGQIHFCCSYFYNEAGLLVKESLAGNLSGRCQIPITLDANGYLIEDGVEVYSIYYTYDPNDSTLLIQQKEDSGLFTTYSYDTSTKQCIGKLTGENNTILSRCFYFYDKSGLLSKTLIDDGSGNDWQDLTGVTTRQIIKTECSQDKNSFGQPLVTENNFLNLEKGSEELLEKIVCKYSKDGLLQLQDFYDANGEWRYNINYIYNEKGELVETKDSRGQTAQSPEKEGGQYRYNSSKQKESMTDKYGNETVFQYDHQSRLTKTIFPDVLDQYDQVYKPTLSQEYDIRNNIIRSQDANGNSTSTTYNVRGKPIEIIYSNGFKHHFTYFLNGHLKESVDQKGNRTNFERDAFGKILKMEEKSSNGDTLQTLIYKYQASALVEISDTQSCTTEFKYDAAGRQTAIFHKTKEGTKKTEWSYDSCGQKQSIKEWFGPSEEDFISKVETKDSSQKTTHIQFENAQGHVQKTFTNEEKQIDEFVFSQELCFKNSRNQFVKQVETVDAFGVKRITTFDALGRIEHSISFNSLGEKIAENNLRYDGNNNKVLEKHSVIYQGQTTGYYTNTWTYDSQNRITMIGEGVDSSHPKMTKYIYDSNGLLEAVIKPNGTAIQYEYDEKFRLSRFFASDQSLDYTYYYDHLGRLSTIQDQLNNYAIQREYNGFNDLISETIGHLTVKNQYDLAGRRIDLTLPDGSGVHYLYDGLHLKKIQRYGTEVSYEHSYLYESSNGKLMGAQLIGNLGNLLYGYDTEGCLNQMTSPWWSETLYRDHGVKSYHHITKKEINDPAGPTYQNYTYADNHQLNSEEGYFNHQYSHDSLYNRIQTDGKLYSINDINQIIGANEFTFNYDPNGNRIAKTNSVESTSYEYDALNRLIRVIFKEKAIQYIYDPSCRRIAKKEFKKNNDSWEVVSTEFFLYDESKEIGKADENGNIKELRILGFGKGAEIGAAIALEFDNQVYAPIHDSQGSVRCLVEMEKGTVAEFYRYSAFGDTHYYDSSCNQIEQSSIGNPWQYASKRYDSETGFIYYGKRYYDPTIGQWTSPDPLFFYDCANLYGFVRNDPLTYHDAYGLFSMSSFWEGSKNALYEGWLYFNRLSKQLKNAVNVELKMPHVTEAFDRVGRKLFGDIMMVLMGYNQDSSGAGVYGKGELNNKVRITFINGILTTKNMLLENAEIISKSHGGINIHYVFRATEGWVKDIGRALLIKLAFQFGYRCDSAQTLAHTWKSLINEMGGVDGGGLIIHYAHSLGGSVTDRARGLLSPEEQRMIRVITFGSATLVRNEGYESVVNYMSSNDGIGSYLIDPLGRVRNYFDHRSNIIWKNQFFAFPMWPCDHLLSGHTYRNILFDLGERFLFDFAQNSC